MGEQTGYLLVENIYPQHVLKIARQPDSSHRSRWERLLGRNELSSEQSRTAGDGLPGSGRQEAGSPRGADWIARWGILLTWPVRVPAKGRHRGWSGELDRVPVSSEFFAKPGLAVPRAGSRLRSRRQPLPPPPMAG